MASLLLHRGATVTIVHNKTKDAHLIAKEADIIVAAAGKPQMVNFNWVKEDAVVIDVGINKINDSSSKRGSRLIGDVNFQDVAPKTSAITPVPGGVGPMTIAMLLSNTVQSFKRKFL